MTQHPVGQGGLFSGHAESDWGHVHWVYDCGSNQSEELRREIAEIRAIGRPDFVFISHLDSDHISGIDQLLASVTPPEVVLPYMSSADLAVAVSYDAGRDALSGTFVDFARNPTSWFERRGVQRVTFIGGDTGSDDGGELDDVSPRPSPPDEQRKTLDKASWDKPTKKLSPSGNAVAQLAPLGAKLDLPAWSYQFDWALVPYAHSPPPKRLNAFKAACKKAFGRIPESDGLADIATTAEGLSLLRECYDHIWKDHNLVSMALYSGPTTSPMWPELIEKRFWNGHLHTQSRGELGWLGCGDFQLSGDRRRRRLVDYFKHLLPRVDVFVVPHHGSSDSYSSDIVRNLPSMSLGIAAAGGNPYGHPHKIVRQSIQRYASFHQVSEEVLSVCSVVATG